MQNVFFHEVEAAYMRRRVQDAVAASGLAAQATPRGTTNLWLIFRALGQASRRARAVLQPQQPVLQPLPCGPEPHATRG